MLKQLASQAKPSQYWQLHAAGKQHHDQHCCWAAPATAVLLLPSRGTSTSRSIQSLPGHTFNIKPLQKSTRHPAIARNAQKAAQQQLPLIKHTNAANGVNGGS
jgi:hypothetical protein